MFKTIQRFFVKIFKMREQYTKEESYKKYFFLAILIILSSCTHKDSKLTKLDEMPKVLTTNVEKLQAEQLAGSYFLFKTKDKYYVYIQGNRRDRSLMASEVTEAKVSEKDSDVTIKLLTEKNKVSDIKNRDIFYELTTSEKI